MIEAARAGRRNRVILLALTLAAPTLAGCVDDRGDGDANGDAGAPRFEAVESLPGARVAVPAHLDGDEVLDVVLAGPDSVWRVHGDGDGFFGAPLVESETANARALVAGDVAGANGTDVLVIGDGVRASMRFDEAPGTEGLAELDDLPARVDSAAAVDADNDGDLDVAVATERGLVVLENGDGSPDANRTTLTDRPTHGFLFLFANDDMLLDLLTLHEDGIALYAHDDEANGTFVPQPEHALPPVTGAVTAVPLDHNNDQRSDALLATSDGLVLLENAGRARYHDATADAGLPTSGAWRSAVAFDADNDGFEDVVALTDDGRLRFFVNTGAGAFTEHAATADDAPRATALATGDFDRDGRVDVIGLGEDESTVFANRGDAGHHLSMHLEGVESNTDGVGAKLTLSTSTFIMYRQAGGVGSGAAASSPDVHFGLGVEPASKYALAVLWPSGTLQFDETESLALLDRHVVTVESEQEAPWDGC